MEREAFLKRVGSRLGRRAPLQAAPERPSVARPRPKVPADLVSTFATAWKAVGGVAQTCADLKEAADALARQAGDWQARSVAVAGESLEAAAVAAQLELEPAPALAADLGVLSADYAIAETGTVVLLSKPGQARTTSLAPPAVAFVVRRERIYATRTELFAKLAEQPVGQSISLITGASRSSDIAGEVVVGVHGPGRVLALVV